MRLSPSCSSLLTVSALLLGPLAQCPAENGEFDPRSAMHFERPVIVGTYALDVERVFGTQVQMARREATKRQREVAEANARAFMAARLKAQHAASGKGKNETARAVIAKLPRYVAVDTVKDARSVPGTKKDVMVWDTQSATLVDNFVYDMSSPPAVGATAKFETYSAQYIGNGMMLPEIAEAPPPADPVVKR
jgi:hypothetical protein